MFCPIFADGFLVEADLAQIEARLIASESGDKRLIRLIKSGEDLHAHAAAMGFEIPLRSVTPEQRQQAKSVVSFGLYYNPREQGERSWGIAQAMNWDIDTADEFVARFEAKIPGVVQWRKDVIEFLEAHGYVRTMTGRIRYLPEIWSADRSERRKAKKQAVNAMIQGPAHDILVMMMTKIRLDIRAQGLKSRLSMSVYDSGVASSPREEVSRASRIMKFRMEDTDSLPERLHLRVPLRTDVKVGRNWADMKEFKPKDCPTPRAIERAVAKHVASIKEYVDPVFQSMVIGNPLAGRIL